MYSEKIEKLTKKIIPSRFNSCLDNKIALLDKTKALKKQFTSTGYVVNPNRTKLLVIFHNKLQKWLPAGGHVESNELPHEAAIREVFEETGVEARIISDDPDMGLSGVVDCQIPRPFSILYQIIPESRKDVEHIHVDFVYAMEAEESELKMQEEEVSRVEWLTKEEILKFDCFDSVKGFVSSFLN